jgi:hypothetical protein
MANGSRFHLLTIAHDGSPAIALRYVSTGLRMSKAIAVAAALGVADHLHPGPRTIEELAYVVGTRRGHCIDCSGPTRSSLRSVAHLDPRVT